MLARPGLCPPSMRLLELAVRSIAGFSAPGRKSLIACRPGPLAPGGAQDRDLTLFEVDQPCRGPLASGWG
jgi:hypothetical protein